jgi:hypothetical protein
MGSLRLNAGGVRGTRSFLGEAGKGVEATEHPEGKRDQPGGEQGNPHGNQGPDQPRPCLAVCGEDRRLRMFSRDLVHI